MIVGIPKEIKDHEYRVGMVPSGVAALIGTGHRVIVETAAGEGSGIGDEEYKRVGAEIVMDKGTVYSEADMVVKVKEPLPSEYNLIREGTTLFTFLHLAANRELTEVLLKKGITGISYDTIQLDDGSLPILAPMSEIAGKLAVQVGAFYLQRERGGNGILLGGVPGVEPGVVTILGSGVVGTNAARIALGIGAKVIMLGRNRKQLCWIDNLFEGRVTTLISHQQAIEKWVQRSDLLIGAVLIVGGRAPHLVTRGIVSRMKKGSVIVDVSIDQGGCVETSRPTTHSEPVYIEEGMVHYCVTNMPGIVPRTSTYALTNATLPYTLRIANSGLHEAIKRDSSLARGINTYQGKVTNKEVAEVFNLRWSPLFI